MNKKKNEGGATSTLSQNMFFAGTNSTIPFTSDPAAAAAAVQMGVSQNTVRAPPTLWQYPSKLKFVSLRFFFWSFKNKACTIDVVVKSAQVCL